MDLYDDVFLTNKHTAPLCHISSLIRKKKHFIGTLYWISHLRRFSRTEESSDDGHDEW